MSDYLSVTKKEEEEMLRAIGEKDVDELFRDIPERFRATPLKLNDGVSQQEAEEIMRGFSDNNKIYKLILRGAGAYSHYIPPVVKALASRSEFVTAYTPYQAEMSQGILQAMFEYQTLIARLTGMDVSNASVYSGATAAAEAILMYRDSRHTEVVLSGAIRPDVKKVIETYLSGKGMTIKVATVREDGKTDIDAIKAALSDKTACVYSETPNFYGVIEDTQSISAAAHAVGVKSVVGANPISLGILKTPRELGADAAVGEGQPLGIPLSFGGPYLGYMAVTSKDMRKLPGRIVGETVDKDGRRAYVLTLQAREQHIRREKASSNICSNEAHCALTAAIYLSAMGKEGLRDVATVSATLAHYFMDNLLAIGLERKYDAEFFHEFVTISKGNTDRILSALDEKGVLGGLKLNDDEILWCVTENANKDALDEVADTVRRAIR